MIEIKFPELTPELRVSLDDRPDGFMTLIETANGKRLMTVYQDGRPKIFRLSKWDNAIMWAKRILGLRRFR